MVAVPKREPPEPPDHPEPAHPDADAIGRDGEILRTINFSGGGFNTVMHVGVIHALLVTQGRAPDVVVGVSAGSIQAAALAEIMRKGVVPETCSKDDYRRVLNERVACLRRVVDACHRAPEDLVDALLPDAYQIESFDPLAPLAQPTLPAEEREQREKWLVAKAGLARLYNELLAINIPVGVIAHLVRRFFGFRAVGNIGRDDWAGAWGRGAARVAETLKLLLLFSEHVTRFAPLAAMLVSPLLANLFNRSGQKPQRDAESIMSRFGIVDRLKSFNRAFWSFVLVLNAWLFISLALLTPLVVVTLQLVVGDVNVNGWWLAFAVVVLTIILFPLGPSLARGDGAAVRRTAWTLVKGLTVFGWNSAKWLLLTLALTAIPVAFIAVLARLSTADPADLNLPLSIYFVGVSAVWLAVVVKFGRTWMCAVFKSRWKKTLGSKLLRAAALQAGRVTALTIALWLLGFVIWVVTLGVEEALQPLLGFLGFEPMLNWLLAFVEWPPDTQPDGRLAVLENIVRRGVPEMPAWTHRIVLDVLIGMLVVALSLAVSLVLILGVAAWILLSYFCRRDRAAKPYNWFLRRFLSRYEIGGSLAHGYPLQRFLVSLFDPEYYGEPELVEAANAALDDTRASQPAPKNKKVKRRRIGHYARAEHGRPAIRLALAVADVRLGRLDVVPASCNVVDALMAALAYPPLLPPVQVGNALYADAINIGNVPSRALLRLLRDKKVKIARISAIHIYAVDPLPVSHDKLSPPIDEDGQPKNTPYLNLVDTAVRALKLQRFRDAKIERRLTGIFTDLLPEGDEGVYELVEKNGGKKKFFRAFIAPVELDRPIDLNAQILYAAKEERRAKLGETIAMGCRAALQVMLARTLSAHAACVESSGEKRPQFIACSKAVALYKSNNGGNNRIRLPGMRLGAPGLAEICKNCAIKNEFGAVIATRSLRILGPEVPAEIEDWPQEKRWSKPLQTAKASPAGKGDKHTAAQRSAVAANSAKALPPARACLFGGGVFRGVFQMGVLSALALVKFRPTLVAGASVGSITAAMAAVVLDETDEAKQKKRLAELASVFLSIDRIVLTDRFADFVRTWTIRASEARFSIREADRVFRKYDFDDAPVFQRTFRAVVAGLERLFYVNPYQLNRIVAAARHRQVHDLVEQLKDCAQGWLDRMHVGTEVLGAEPLRKLIERFVVDKAGHAQAWEAVQLKELSKRSTLLATTTNLTQGTLRVLGSRQDGRRRPITLIETLLASSAFPGVFRPRRSWDLLPGDNAEDEYVDGGIVDNLPLDPVLQELRAQAVTEPRTLDLRPEHPHLMVAASLEPCYPSVSPSDIKPLKKHWPDVRTRLRELQYNVKLNMYKSGLREVSDVYDALQKEGKTSPRVPLHVKLVAVEPEWLCDTFAFHPMLGFRRAHQAKSIAHGCASTLCSFSSVREGAEKKWGLEEKAIPELGLSDANKQRPAEKLFKEGKCWLVQNVTCPFSRQGQGSSTLEDSRHWVSEIHRHCWDPQTHQRENWHKRNKRRPAARTENSKQSG